MVRFRLDTREWGELGEEYLQNLRGFTQKKREFFGFVGQAAIDIVRFVYETDASDGAGYFHPTKFSGLLGEAFTIQMAVGEKRSWMVLLNDMAYFAFVEAGRGPGGVPVDILKDWASAKLGLDPDGPETKAIINNIRRFGIVARQLLQESLGAGTPGGRRWDQVIEARADLLLARLIDPGTSTGQSSLGSLPNIAGR